MKRILSVGVGLVALALAAAPAVAQVYQRSVLQLGDADGTSVTRTGGGSFATSRGQP